MQQTTVFVHDAAGFNRGLEKFIEIVFEREERLFGQVQRHIERSIREGSEVTGAPGQPVKTGRLLGSWKRFGTLASRDVVFASALVYAPIIEDNWRQATLRSKVGGFHSVKITKMNYRWIVKYELDIIHAKVK